MYLQKLDGIPDYGPALPYKSTKIISWKHHILIPIIFGR